jgi:stress-induced morphogen
MQSREEMLNKDTSGETPQQVTDLEERRRSQEQYFFTKETVEQLTPLCKGKTACLCTPTVAESALEEGKDAVLFDIDPRFRTFFGENSFEPYDLYRGLHSHHQANADRMTPKYEYAFDSVIVDPPFAGVSPEQLAQNVNALLKWDITGESYAYIVYPKSGEGALENAFEAQGMVGQIREDIPIKHINTPRGYDAGKKQIVLFQFRRV